MKTRGLIVMFGLLFLVGCASSGTNFHWDDVERVEPGMTSAQVRQMLGDPTMVSKTMDEYGKMVEMWVWSYAKVGFMGSNMESKSVAISFKDGVVVGIPNQTVLSTKPETKEEQDPDGLR